MIDFESAPDGKGGSNRDRPRFGADPVVAERPRDEIPPYIAGLNDRQREAALITEGPLIVLAGAGSGKTKMLTSRIAYLMDVLGVPGHQIMAVTFTNKAAGEMRERVEKILRESGGRAFGTPEIGTFHAVCVRILRRELERTPFTKPFVIYDDSDQLSLIKSVFTKLGIDEKVVSPKAVQAGINRVKCDAAEPHELNPASHNIFEKKLKQVYEQYQKDLFANNALDFGEIICMAYRLFRDHPELREKYQRRFRYIHVDEYQDTNRAQYLLLSALAGRGTGGHQNMCVVGDEDQSIYKWRGADIRNILDFERDFPGAQIVKLEQNYRSTRTIIKAAGRVIANNTARKDKTLWTQNADGERIVRMQLPDERAEAELTVAEIKRLSADDGRSHGDFAIFYRTNAQSRQFEDILRREKIPYQIVGGLRFYDRKEIKDVLSYFKAVLNPSDSVSMKRIINVPGRGIGKTTVEKIEELHLSGTVTFWEVLQRVASDASVTSPATAKKIAQFTKLMQRLMDEQPKLMLSELYHLILDETGYVRSLKEEATEESLARIENLEEFDTLLQEFDEDNFHSIPEEERQIEKAGLLPLFIEQSSLASDTDKLDSYASSVKMMTLHSSKGLEFPVVFIAGMEEGLFPSIKQWEEVSDEDIEEERRLCYVGMTRARERLYLMNVVVRRIWGNPNFNDPSRFFEEMPSDLVEVRDFARSLGGSGGFSGTASRYGSAGTGYGSRGGQGAGNAYGAQRRPQERDDDDDFNQDQRPPWKPTLPPASPASGTASGSLIGQKLRHPEYGPGTIIAAEGGGDDRKVTVEFAGKTHRKFLFRYVAAYIA
ncbi:MAG: UvrD-helicase domain-containing protein [Oligoflexia bacterium]|nr:UvrD-helicase domain-containing protein [Oligoflexia bacterium]